MTPLDLQIHIQFDYGINPGYAIEALKINQANYKRQKTLKERIEKIIKTSKNTYFITLTFTDNVLESTSEKTRRRYITRYLKQFDVYVANVDYGSKNDREHYHAVVGTSKDIKEINQYWTKKYGFVKNEKVRINRKDNGIKLAKYVSKLSNHAIKNTNKRNVIIYSRNTF